MDITGIVEQLGDMARRMREGEDVGFAEDCAAVEMAASYLPLLAHALWVRLDGVEVVVTAADGPHALAMRVVDQDEPAILVKRAR